MLYDTIPGVGYIGFETVIGSGCNYSGCCGLAFRYASVFRHGIIDRHLIRIVEMPDADRISAPIPISLMSKSSKAWTESVHNLKE